MSAASDPGGGDVLARLRSYEGRQAGPAQLAPDPVNQPMIRHWVEAIGDENPVYVDAEAAARSVHGQVIAPPTMLQAWVMRGFRPPPPEGDGAGAADELYDLLDAAGFTSVVATDCEQTYHRQLHPGDHLSMVTTVESVSPEKRTGLGVGHFVTTRSRYVDQEGEPVADMSFRILKFKPGTGRPAPPARPPRPRPAITRDNEFFFAGAQRHELLIQRCTACGHLRHPAGPVCPRCRSYEWDAVAASGRGTVYSFVVIHHPQVPAFDYPLVVALVELEEGTRLVSDLVDVAPEDVRVGMPVEVQFVACDPDLTLPLFRPVDDGVDDGAGEGGR